MPLVVHADWSKDAAKCWMTLIRHHMGAWHASAPERVGSPWTLLARLRARASGAPVAFGIDCPLGLPRHYVARHLNADGFPDFLRTLDPDAAFFEVADALEQVSGMRPFYPARGIAGMTRLSHALALGLPDARALCRACDQATPERPAGAPVFWTLGANQSGKAAIAAWRDLIMPALHAPEPVRLWPFDGAFANLLSPGTIVMAETYPADAMRQLGVRRAGSKRRHADRQAYAPFLRRALERLAVTADEPLELALADGFGVDAMGEDRMDSLFGALCVLGVVTGQRMDQVPEDPWIRSWEGWVLGQTLPFYRPQAA
jgi:hypothetical protein